jgi:type IV secretory pathway VirB10-like protein
MGSMNEGHMLPETSPGAPNKAGVRKVNNMPVYIIGGLIGIFLLVMMLVAADRAEQQNRPADRIAERANNTNMYAKEIAGSHQDGFIKAQEDIKPLEIPGLGQSTNQIPAAIPIARPSVDFLQAPPPAAGPSPDMQRIQTAKLQQFEDAVKAKTNVPVTPPRSSGSTSYGNTPADSVNRLADVRQQIGETTRNDPTAAYQAKLAQLKSTGGGIPGGNPGFSAPPSSGLLPTSSAGGNGYTQFSGQGEGDRWTLDTKVQTPRSAYELRAGYVLPATLISGINSDLPGQIVAQVSQTVYDTPTGKYALIPQGSRLVGSYQSGIAYGQERVLVAWQRIVFPDGKALDIGAMPGSDSAGYSGFNDQVNNHYLRLFGSAVLMSAVTAGISLSQPDSSDGDNRDFSSAMSESLGQQLGQVTAQLISKNMNIAPTLEIRPGYRFNVVVTKDLTFEKPYQAFDY